MQPLWLPSVQGLKETSFVEGQNLAIEYRWADNQLDRLPAWAADLVSRKVAVIVTSGSVPQRWRQRPRRQRFRSYSTLAWIRLPLALSRASIGRAGISPV
jgi:hypothetical protein